MFENSKWIWLSDEPKADEYAEFELPLNVKSGATYTLDLSCDSDYALYCGDRLLAFGQYADYADYKIYDSLTLDGLPEGDCQLKIIVWYCGADSFSTYIKKPAGLIFSVYENGREVLVSNGDILCRRAKGYIPYRCLAISSQQGYTFSYDATLEGGEFASARRVSGLPSVLYPRPNKKTVLCDRVDIEPLFGGGYTVDDPELPPHEQMMEAGISIGRIEKCKPGYQIVNPKGGVYIIGDIGREEAGFIDFDIEVEADCDIIFGWGEHLCEGRCRTRIGHRNFSFTYRAKAGRNVYMNPFRRLGCRYIQLFADTDRIKINHLGLRPVNYPLTYLPFETDDLLRRRIYQVAVDTLRLCMHEHYEDCPWREQALYTLDSRNQMLCGYYAFGEYEFPRSCLELISHGLREDGLLNLCFPADIETVIPAFSLIYPIQVREYMEHSGDIEFVAGKYGFMRRLLDVFLARRGDGGLLQAFCGKPGLWNFYEWSETMDGTYRVGADSYEAPLNAFFSLSLEAMSAIACRLGKSEEAAELASLRASLNAAIGRRFYNKEDRLFESFTDRAHGVYSVLTNSLCLGCGAADGLDTERIVELLCTNGPIDDSLTVVPDTLSMICFRYDALLRLDCEKYKSVVLADLDATYMRMLESGATAFWETAKGPGAFKDAGSLCHGWSALPVYYYRKLL